MSQLRGTMPNRYVKAGNALKRFERIAVKSYVSSEETEGTDGRACYRAENQGSKWPLKVPLPIALTILLVVAVLMASSSLSRVQYKAQIRQDTLQRFNTLKSLEQKGLSLMGALSEASNESEICYRAARDLGMHRAVDEEVIRIYASQDGPQMMALHHVSP